MVQRYLFPGSPVEDCAVCAQLECLRAIDGPDRDPSLSASERQELRQEARAIIKEFRHTCEGKRGLKET